MENLDNLLKSKIACEETGIEIKKTICDICNNDSHCAINAYIKDGKIIKVEGSKDNPHSYGKLCPRGAATRQYIYSKDRIMYPMKRIGAKGSGEFERITWDEAYDIISEKLNGYKKEYGGKSVAFFAGFSKWYRPTLYRLANKFGTPNFITEGSTCQVAHTMAWKLVFGAQAGADYKNTKLLFVWSRNPAYSDLHCSDKYFDEIEKGMKMIVVDPRITPMTQRAELHLRLKPGTDGALALGIANVIISENLYDKEFVEKYGYGFEEFKEYVKEYTPEKTERITGVKKEDMIKAARLYAATKPAAMLTSASPVVHHVNGIQNYRAVMCLVALTGNYDIIGGNRVLPSSYLHVSSFAESNEEQYRGEKFDKEPGIGQEEFPVWFELVKEEAQAMRLPDYILKKKPYEIKALVGVGMNHRMWPDTNYILEALNGIEFFVSIDLFMTEACKHADIVLPACSSLERTEIKVFSDNYICSPEVAIEPLGESKNDIIILTELSKKLGIDDEMLNMTYDEYMDYMIEPTGVTLEELRENKNNPIMARNIGTYKEKKYETEGFNTPSGKVEFVSNILAKYSKTHGYDSLPKYKSFQDIYPEYENNEYPMIMNTGSRRPQFMHSRTYRMDWIKNLEEAAFVDISLRDAERYGIKQGDKVVISTLKGSIEAVANVTIVSQEGVLSMYHGNPDADVNILMDKDFLDPISGYPGFKCFPCKISKK